MSRGRKCAYGTELLEFDYDADADALGSWQAAIDAMRERHQEVVLRMAPGLWRLRAYSYTSRVTLAAEIGVSAALLEEWENCRSIAPPDLFDRWRNLLGA